MIKNTNRTNPGTVLLFSVILLLFFGGSSCGNQSGEKIEKQVSGFLNKSTEDDSEKGSDRGAGPDEIGP